MFKRLWALTRAYTRKALNGAYRSIRLSAATMQALTYIVRDPIRSRSLGTQKLVNASRAAVFVHYDAEGLIHDYVVHHVRALTDAGFAVVFVSNSPRLNPQSTAHIMPYVATVLHRKNVGYDFGAYKDGINEIPSLDDLELLVLTNDSVYGPFSGLSGLVDQFDSTADVWGLTDCWDTRWHVQSYFMGFRSSALKSRAFVRFWKNMLYISDREWVIRHCEIDLSTRLANSGLRIRALFPFREARRIFLTDTKDIRIAPEERSKERSKERRTLDLIIQQTLDGAPLNATHYYWWVLSFEMGFPYLKRDLIRSNPWGVPYLYHWHEMVQKFTAYDVELIDSHLHHTGTQVVT